MFYDQALVIHSVSYIVKPVASGKVVLDPGTDGFGHPPRCSFEESETLTIIDESAIFDDAFRVVEDQGTRP